MINTYKRIFIDTDELDNWLKEYLGNDFKNKEVTIIDKPEHCRGESKFFADVDVYEKISREEFINREVKEHTRYNRIHFYVDDVISAACKAGMLKGDSFCIYYTW